MAEPNTYSFHVPSSRYGSKLVTVDAHDRDFVIARRWSLKARKRVKAGDVIFYVTTDVREGTKRVRKYLHRLLLGEPEGVVDHVDGNPLNNTRANLRSTTQQKNTWNTHSTRGYYWNSERQRWQAQIHVDRKCINLGRFDSEDDAREAYLQAKRQHHPEAR